MTINIIRADTRHLHSLCVYIRVRVFMDEQHYTLENELEPDEDEAVFFLAMVDGEPAGTVRYRLLGNTARIERLAVLPDYRGHGIGATLMDTVLADIATHKGLTTIELIAQEEGLVFHERYGFTSSPAPHVEAGHPHYLMAKIVNN